MLKEKPIIKLYEYKNSNFVLTAQIDDYQECSFNHNRFQAGQFIIQINYNIPNASLFQRGLFVQFGNGVYDFGEILNIQDTIGEDGKGSQIRTITGYDTRYLFKRRVIRNLNDADSWTMTAKGELVMRNLIKDQCGAGAEAKRQLPITNVIPTVANAIGKEYSCKESFSNLYEVLQTIATQSEIGWRVKFEGGILTLEFYAGNDLKDVVKFDTDFESLANGTFTDSSESFSNAVFVAGKGTGTDRDIYEGENEIGGSSPAGLDRFESYDNQSQMTTEEQYEAEALSMLNQYGQTLTVSGKGLVQCPYIFREQYDVGDIITIHFSGKSAVVQILAVTEHWAFGSYELEFQFGKPINDLSSQLQLILRQIQKASSKTNACTSVKWYTIPTDTEQEAGDVIYDTLGFTGTSSSNTFTIYLDDEGTGAKVYNLYVKNLTGSLTLTTGFVGAEDLVISGGSYTGSILVDTLGNISLQSSTVAVNETGVTPSGTASTITVGGETYNLGGGTEVEANPQGSATDTLNKLDVAGTIYSVSDVKGNTGETPSQAITDISIDGTVYSIPDVVGNSGQTPSQTLSDLKIDGTVYSVSGGGGVEHTFKQDRLSFSYSGATSNTSNVSLSAGTYMLLLSFDYDYTNSFSGNASVSFTITNGDNSLSYASISGGSGDYQSSYHKLRYVAPMIIKVPSTTNHRVGCTVTWPTGNPASYWRFYRHYVRIGDY